MQSVLLGGADYVRKAEGGTMATGEGEKHSLFGRVVIRAEPEALNKVTQYRLSFTYVATLLAAS